MRYSGTTRQPIRRPHSGSEKVLVPAGLWPLEERWIDSSPLLTSSTKDRTATPRLGQVGVLEHDSIPAAHKDDGLVRPTLEDAAATHWEALLVGLLP